MIVMKTIVMKKIMLAVVVMVAVFLIPVTQSSPSAQAAAQAPADPNAWTIDTSHSAANFAVRHLMVSTVRADVTIDVAGINTANQGRAPRRPRR